MQECRETLHDNQDSDSHDSPGSKSSPNNEGSCCTVHGETYAKDHVPEYLG